MRGLNGRYTALSRAGANPARFPFPSPTWAAMRAINGATALSACNPRSVWYNGPMNKTQLVEAIQAKLGPKATKKAAAQALDAFIAVISKAAKLDKVQIPGFGTFETKTRAARTGRNPISGEKLTIPASTTLSFKPAAKFKTILRPAKKTAKKK